MCEGEMLRIFLDQRVNKKERIKRNSINCRVYINKLLILGQDALVRICSKLNDDKMVKNPFLRMSMGKI